MARTISPALATRLATAYGEEPVNIIEIQWAKGGQRTAYADKDIPSAGIKGRIMELSQLDFVINVDSGSDSADISVALSDIDGEFKNIIDNVDIHKRDVWVYQWMEGMSLSDKVLIFQGEINSPITWNEGDRTLKFQVVSKIEDAEIGFSIEEGQIPNPAPELIGKPWPLKFGTTYNVPALRYTSPIKGTLVTGVGISDFTLNFRINAAEKVVCPQVWRGYKTEFLSNGIGGGSLQIMDVYTTDEACALTRCETIQNLKKQRTEQRKYEYEKIVIIDGKLFVQDTIITLDIDGGKFTGKFIGTAENPSNTFQIVSRKHPKFDELGGIPTDSKVRAIIKKRITDAISKSCPHLTGGQPDGYGGVTVGYDYPVDPSRKLAEESERSLEFFNAVPKADFFWANPGSSVTLDAGEEVVYVTNILPETIHNLAAFRRFEAGRKLVTVPPSYYTVRTTDFGTYDVTEVVFDKALSKIDDTWDDDIYVTSTSSVGPNTVDIIQWIIEKYTDFDIDTVSFAYVKNRLENYPSDFPVLERKNVLEILREIAYQARCAIYIRDRKFYLRYLSEEPEEVDDFDASDIDANSFEIFHTPTEDIVTKLTAEWQRDYSLENPNKLILRHNIEKYGVQEEVYNWYIYNEIDYISKSATFWLLRKANTWKQVRFSTPIHKLKLETFDGCGLDLSAFCPSEIRCLITKSDWNSDSRTLDFELWTPVRSGTNFAYDFAWPADISEEIVWPTEEDYDLGNVGSGSAPGFSATPPPGHPLRENLNLAQGFQLGPCGTQTTHGPLGDPSKQTCGDDKGDKYPSDEGDSKKEKDVQGNSAPDSPVDPGEVQVGNPTNPGFGKDDDNKQKETEKRLNDLEKKTAGNTSQANSAGEGSGGRGSGGQPPKDGNGNWGLPGSDDIPEGQCKHWLEISVWKITAVNNSSTGLGTDPGDTGAAAAATPVRTDKVFFPTFCETTQAGNALNRITDEKNASDGFTVGEVAAYGAVRHEDFGCITDNCGRQGRDEDDNPTGYPANPTGVDQDIYDSASQDDPDNDNHGPQDYWDDIANDYDQSDCKNESCPPSDEGGGEPEENGGESVPDGNGGTRDSTSTPAGPINGETWKKGSVDADEP